MAPRSRGALGALLLLGCCAAAAAALPAAPDRLDGVKKDIRLKNFAGAAASLQGLATTGDAEAQYLLATFYLNGLNGPRDLAQARVWLEKAATQGHARAAFSLANLLANADPPDPQAADHWLSRARELGFSAPARQSAVTGHSAAPLKPTAGGFHHRSGPQA